MRIRYLPATLGIVIFGLPAVTLADTAAKPTVAVYSDRNSPSPQHAAQLADILADQIVQKGDLAVVDRQHTQSILEEQSTSSAGQVTPATQAQLGRMLGVNYLVVVRIESLVANVEQRNDVLSILSKQASYVTKVSLSDSVSIVDVRSAQIVETLDDQQQTTSPPSTGADQAFATDAMTSLLKTSAVALAGKIDAAKLVSAPAQGSPLGKILDVNGDSVTLSLGKASGLTVGEMIDVFEARSILNPDTGKTIQTLLKRGTLQVTQVEDDYSVATTLAGVHVIKFQVVRAAPQ